MDLLNPLWVRVSGANINRDTVANVESAGIGLDEVESRAGIIRLIRGSVEDKATGEEAAAGAEDVA